ncbi:type II secretion system F family protein [Exiguobacterium sp. BRG2]|uniref:type II secretion system F family protein n=1 Tax=Exiguobacterium sp. BRG2 TaxID=2962584 RepID=UPI002881427C|nr:type II secretion system F family protein [Exiguobacterium sp. BRG2]MDT0172580.1 type II secretion system F family protein [Exiguobacterium sp. BRG2]
MAVFTYEGRTMAGKRKKGKITALTKREAAEKLRTDQIAVTSLEKQESKGLNTEITFLSPKPKIEHLVMYARQFATLVRSGVSIVKATEILRKQTESKPLERALIEVEDDLRSGIQFSKAIEKHPRVFDTFFVSMAMAGEASGNLEEALENIVTQLQKQYEIKRKVISALIYPAVVSLVAVGVVVFLMMNVVPTFASIFDQLGSELPLITKLVVAVSDFFVAYWWVMLLIAFGLIGLLYFNLKNERQRLFFDRFLLIIPVFGPLIQKSQIALMTRGLSVLLNASVPILASLDITERIVTNRIIRKGIAEANEAMARGIPMHEPLEKNKYFPPLVTQMIAIGEETGRLDSMLTEVANFYETEVETTTDRLKSIIEPLLIVVLAAIVGVIVIAVVVPMFKIYSDIQAS